MLLPVTWKWAWPWAHLTKRADLSVLHFVLRRTLPIGWLWEEKNGKSNWLLKENKHGNALYALLRTSTHLHSQRCLRRLFWLERSFKVNANKPGPWHRLWQGRELAHSDLWAVYQINNLTVSLLSTRPSVRCGVIGCTWQDKTWSLSVRTSQSTQEAVTKHIKDSQQYREWVVQKTNKQQILGSALWETLDTGGTRKHFPWKVALR